MSTPNPDPQIPAMKTKTKTPRVSHWWKKSSVQWTWWIFTVIYLGIVIWAIGYAASNDFKIRDLTKGDRLLVIFSGILISMLPTLYWWHASWRFESWIDMQQFVDKDGHPDEKQTDFEKERFKTNREHAKALWAVILTVFATYLINSR
jgi:hypothetical protein